MFVFQYVCLNGEDDGGVMMGLCDGRRRVALVGGECRKGVGDDDHWRS